MTENFCVHAFKPMKSKLSNILASKLLRVRAFMRSNIEIGISPQIKLRLKIFAFKLLCFQTSEVRALKFFGIKIVVRCAFMRSNFEIGLNPEIIVTENFCVHVFLHSNQ